MTPSAVSISPVMQQGRVNPTPPIGPKGEGKGGFKFWGDDGFTFGDLIDLINRMQHVPLVSTLYRKITGDAIAAGPRLLGGALFRGITGGVTLLGSLTGFATATANSLVEQKTGKDVGEHVLALFYNPEKPTVVAAAAPPKALSEIPPVARYDQKVSHLSAPTSPDWTSHAVATALDKYVQSLRLAAPLGTRVDVEF